MQYVIKNGDEVETFDWKGDFADVIVDLVLSNESVSFQMSKEGETVTVEVE